MENLDFLPKIAFRIEKKNYFRLQKLLTYFAIFYWLLSIFGTNQIPGKHDSKAK